MHFNKWAVSFTVPVSDRRHTSNKAILKRVNPTLGGKAILKRANPTIGEGIDVNDPNRGGKLVPRPGLPQSGAIDNALQLMYYATTTSDNPNNDAVFRKYFNEGDKQVVMDVFNRLLGDDDRGAAALANIRIIAGDDDPNDPAPASLAGYADPDPELILSEDAWHWDWFLGSIHGGDIIDQPNGYGWQNARALDKNLAKFNADSYGWYATEWFWATICAQDGGYNAPGDKSGQEKSRIL